MNINVSEKLIYLGAGCGIGVVLGLLFAPRSGEEIRHTLTSRVDNLTNKLQEKVHDTGIVETTGQTWRNVVDKGRNIANIGRTRLNESIEAGRRKYDESIETEDRTER
jgi:gas vesicle protein